MKGKSYKEIQKLFDKTYKQVNSFVPMESDDKDKDSEKKAGGSRKKTLARKRAGEKQSEESAKRQKIEDDAEKEELRAHLDIIPGYDVAISVESLATKYPIVDWKTHVLSKDKMYYEINRANGSTKSYKIFKEMLDDFDRQDVLDLYRLVKERFETASPEGYDRLLWGDLITVFEPSKDDKVWKAQQDYTLISWRLFDSCGIHVLLRDIGITIHMLIEKTYPLTQEMLSRVLSGKLEVDNESEMAFELFRFTRSQIESRRVFGRILSERFNSRNLMIWRTISKDIAIREIVDNCKKGLGYNAVPPPYIGNFMPPTIEEWVSDSEEENVSQTKIEKKTTKPSFVKIDFVKAKQTNKTDRKTAKQGGKTCLEQCSKGESSKLCKKDSPSAKKNMVPRAVLMKSGLVSVNTARQVNAAHSKATVNATKPMSYFSKKAHSTVKRPSHKNTTFKNSNFNQRVNTVKGKNVNTARPKAVVNAARPKAVVNAVKGNN
ncbi:hypothetical protein Tco_1100336, partial [Tanacetum coccineum]